MTKHFEMLHEAGERNIASLWASWAAIYQRYGYGIVGTRVSYTIEPQHVRFAEDRPSPGKLRETGIGQIETLKDIYRKFVEFRTGYLHRSQPMWQASIFSPPPPAGAIIGVMYEEKGEPLGYMIYATIPVPGDPVPNHRVQLRDMIWLNSRAYRALWENLSILDLLKEIIWQRAPADDPLFHLLLEPRRLHATVNDGLLARIVTVEKGLAERGYDVAGELVFELKDDLCPWNAGRWKLETSARGSKVSRSKLPAQVTMPVSTLALLAFGQVSASEAERMGRLDADTPEALPLWGNVMRTRYKAACPDMF
jgi:predicted acetyltransferase